MTEMLINILLLYALFFILALVNSQVAFWLHWAMGTPRFEPYLDGATHDKSALLSFVGAFLVRKFNQYHLKTKGEKANPYKALGICITCFAVHISNLMTLLYAAILWHLTGFFNPWLLLLALLSVTSQSLLFVNMTYHKIH